MNRHIGFALAFAGTLACQTWAHMGTPEEAVTHAGSGTVRVTRIDSSVVLVQSPKIVQDTLIGTSVGDAHIRIAIPMAASSDVAKQEFSPWRSAGAGYLTVLGALGVALLVLSVALLAVK